MSKSVAKELVETIQHHKRQLDSEYDVQKGIKLEKEDFWDSKPTLHSYRVKVLSISKTKKKKKTYTNAFPQPSAWVTDLSWVSD